MQVSVYFSLPRSLAPTWRHTSGLWSVNHGGDALCWLYNSHCLAGKEITNHQSHTSAKVKKNENVSRYSKRKSMHAHNTWSWDDVACQGNSHQSFRNVSQTNLHHALHAHGAINCALESGHMVRCLRSIHANAIAGTEAQRLMAEDRDWSASALPSATSMKVFLTS